MTKELSCMMNGFDHFNNINDTCGHLVVALILKDK